MESTVERKDECVKETCHHGIQMTEEELAETIQCWKDIARNLSKEYRKGK